MKGAFSFLVVAALAVFGLVGCQPTKTPTQRVCAADAGVPSDPVAAATAADVDEPLAQEQAGEEAKDAFAESEIRDAEGTVPLVTVEEGPNGPEIVSTPVASEDEAEAVAEQAAVDGDLVAVEADTVVSTATAPDDPRFDEQYAFDLLNFLGTWQFPNNPDNFGGSKAGEGQVVAIIDTGVDETHEELDEPGRVRAGMSFIGGSANEDTNGHGTFLAGIVAAETNNMEGIAGAAPAAEILPVKVLNVAGSGLGSVVAQGIVWAAENGATVINLSLGGPNPSQAQHAAIQYAVHTFGIPVIASAGNQGKCGPFSYPAAFPEVLAVAAVDQFGSWAGLSTTASYVSVAAPGVAILSTVPNSATPSNGYKYGNGTSFAAPYVSAIAAILRAYRGFTASGVYAQISQTALDLPPDVGWDPETGFGLANPYGAAFG